MRAGVICLLAAFVCLANAMSMSSPLFMWSGQRTFANLNAVSGHAHATDVLSSEDVEVLMHRLAGQHTKQGSRIASYLEEKLPASPEVILAFVNSKIGPGSSSASLLANLKTTLASSGSSLSAPYFKADGSVANLLATSVSALSSKSQTISTKLAADSTADCDNLLARLSSDKFSSIFSNGVPDLLLVTSEDISSTNACIKRVSEKVSKLTSGKYVGLFTAETATPSVRTVFAEGLSAAALLQSSAPITHSTNGLAARPQDNYIGPQFITPTILIGLLIAGLLLFWLLLIICCVMSVQPPLRFATQRLTVGKEY